MKKPVLFLLMMIIASIVLAKDVKAITDNGKTVILHENGTWEILINENSQNNFDFKKTNWGVDKSNVRKSVPAEYKSALNKATLYANTMQMSKRGVYNQLVSEYGEKFSAAAAQYAIDNVEACWGANALAKAKNYQDTMNMSPASIHDQLTSEYGEKFTQAEADYAILHLND